MFPRKHSLLPLPCVEDIYFFSLYSSLDCFKIPFCDYCIFHSASAVSLHWIEPGFYSNLDLLRHHTDSALFQPQYIVADFTFQVFVAGWLIFFPTTKRFHHSSSFSPTRFCKMVPMVTWLNTSLCLALPSVIFACRRKGGIMTSHPHCFYNKAKLTFFGTFFFLQRIFSNIFYS